MLFAGSIWFSVRIASAKVVDGLSFSRKMCCSKEGYQKPNVGMLSEDGSKRRHVQDVRCGCHVKMYITLDTNNMLWRVATFIEAHNHPMDTPLKRQYLGVNRHITPLSYPLFQSLNSSNLSGFYIF